MRIDLMYRLTSPIYKSQIKSDPATINFVVEHVLIHYEKLNHIPSSSSDVHENIKVMVVKRLLKHASHNTGHSPLHARYIYMGLHKPRELTSRTCQSK